MHSYFKNVFYIPVTWHYAFANQWIRWVDFNVIFLYIRKVMHKRDSMLLCWKSNVALLPPIVPSDSSAFHFCPRECSVVINHKSFFNFNILFLNILFWKVLRVDSPPPPSLQCNVNRNLYVINCAVHLLLAYWFMIYSRFTFRIF